MDVRGQSHVSAPSQRVPVVSVFTPSHRPAYLDRCLATLLAQTFTDWEWIVVLNQGARWQPGVADPRVRIAVRDTLAGVGATKGYACDVARGEILVELDHDDELRSDALEAVVRAFEKRRDVVLVYSDCAQITKDGSADPSRWDASWGWTYRDAVVDGRRVLQVDSLEPTPHNVSYIWYAPNHVRAFRRSAYEAVGGYDPARDVLDDQDLMCRLYQIGDVFHIAQCLYLQRVHEHNTQRVREINERIQQETLDLYDTYVQSCALAWARRQDLLALDLGAAHRKAPGFLGVDRRDAPGVDVVADVSRGIDLPDSSVGVIRAVDFLTHVPDKVAVMNELYRLLAHGGMLLSLTPSTDGRGAFQDPTHVAYYNENSFWYFTDAAFARYVPEITCRFQVSRLGTYFPDAWHAEHNFSYVCANLVAIKDGPRQGGILSI
ncbi:MAG: glycosyltransferase [Acidimicrobiales bacterium]